MEAPDGNYNRRGGTQLRTPRPRETLHQHFGRTRQASHRIQIARIKQQSRSHELVKRAARGAAWRDGAEVHGQAPAGIEGHPVYSDPLTADQRLEACERAVHMEFVDHRDQCSHRCTGLDVVGEGCDISFRDQAAAVTGQHVRMGLVDDLGVRPRLFSGAAKQFDIGGQRTAAGYRTVILDLSGHKHVMPVPSVAGKRLDATGLVF